MKNDHEEKTKIFTERIKGAEVIILRSKKFNGSVILRSTGNYPEIITPEIIFLITGKYEIKNNRITDKYYYDVISLFQKLNIDHQTIKIY